MGNKNILILCTGNSCRSQIAEGYLKFFLKNRANVFSAGVDNHEINSLAIKTMKDDGIDISKQTSNNINEFNGVEFDHIITVCDNAKEICPIYPHAKQLIHNSFLDPADAQGTEEQQLKVYAKVRNQLRDYFKSFVEEKLNQ